MNYELMFITWNPSDTIFRIGHFALHWYSMCWLVGLLLAYLLVRRLYKEQKIKDEQRTNDLNTMNLTVARICNLDIDRNFRGVCAYVDRLVQNSLPQSPSVTAPSSEGALDATVSKQ